MNLMNSPQAILSKLLKKIFLSEILNFTFFLHNKNLLEILLIFEIKEDLKIDVLQIFTSRKNNLF